MTATQDEAAYLAHLQTLYRKAWPQDANTAPHYPLHPSDQSELPIHFSGEEQSPVAADLAAGEVRLHLSPLCA